MLHYLRLSTKDLSTQPGSTNRRRLLQRISRDGLPGCQCNLRFSIMSTFIPLPPNVTRGTRNGRTYFTTPRSEERVDAEMVYRSRMQALRAFRRHKRPTDHNSQIEIYEATLQFSNLILGQLARQENSLQLAEGHAAQCKAIQKREALRTETAEALMMIQNP